MTIQSLPLTRQQVEDMANPNSDWLRMTKEQEAFIAGTPDGFLCHLYDDAILRLSHAEFAAMMGEAWHTATLAAASLLLGRNVGMEAVLNGGLNVVIDPPEVGQTFVRVTCTDDMGRSASGIGMIPDPRAH
ncbi:MAG: hypothetical protein QM599_01800 [Pseudoxanthomonas sp.]